MGRKRRGSGSRLYGEEGGGTKQEGPADRTPTNRRAQAPEPERHSQRAIADYLECHLGKFAWVAARIRHRGDADFEDFRQEVHTRLQQNRPFLSVKLEAALYVVVRSTLADFVRLIYRRRHVHDTLHAVQLVDPS